MKIDKLKITKYKNLVNCEFDFSNSDGLSVVAGINGSGKSNLLEAILLIMQDFWGMPKPINREWPLYEIAFTQGDESFSVSRDSSPAERPYVKRISMNNDVVETHNNEYSVIYMYSGEFNRLLASKMEYGKEFEISAGIYSIAASDLKVAMLVLALENLHDSDNGTSLLIDTPTVTEITYRINREIHVDEAGPENEVEALLLWMSQQGVVNDKVCISLSLLSDGLERVGVVAPRDMYYILSNVFEDKGGAILSDVDIKIESTDGGSISLEDLSEGEKRLLLLKFIFEVLARQKSLILLDEPDAHVHEGRRIDLYSYLEANSGNEIFTICTSHSPSIVNAVHENSLIGLRLDEDGMARVVEKDAISTFRDIADGRMGYFSTKPIVLFEGKIDVAYVSSALKYFNREDVLGGLEFLTCGGAGEMEGVYSKLSAIIPNRQFRVYCDKDSGGLVAMKDFAMLYDVAPVEGLDEAGRPKWKNCSDIPPEIISKLGERGVSFLPHPFDKCSDYAIEDYFSRDFLIGALEARLQDQNSHLSLKYLNSVGEQVKKKLYDGATTMPDSEKRRFAPIVRSVVEFYNNAYRNESIDVSFIVPIIEPVDEEDVNRQLGSLERAIENLANANNLNCAPEMLAVNTLADARIPALEKYHNVISCPSVNVEKAICEGVRNAKGDYVVVVWQKSTIQESLLRGISIGLNGLPNFMLLDLDCGFQDGAYFDLTNESQARKAFEILNTATPVTSFCISRRFLLAHRECIDHTGAFSDRIGMSLLLAGKAFWAESRAMSRWRGLPMEQPSMQSNSETDTYIKAKFDSWTYRKNGDALFF